MLLGALAVVLVSHVLCALAPSVSLLIAARVMQGFGGGGLMTLSQALVGETVPPRDRGRFQGYMASVFVSSSMFGPVAGGWLTQHLGWRAVFLVNIPVTLLAMLLALRLPVQPRGPGKLHFDVLGTVLFAGFITPALMALEEARQFSWSSLFVALALVALSVASLFLLLRQERRALSPLLPVQFLRQPAVWRTNGMAICNGALIVSLITFLPIYFAVVQGAGPGEIGVMMLPLTGLIAVGSMFTGRLISKTGYTAIIPSIGLPVLTLLLLGLALLAPTISRATLPWLLGAIALFAGTAMPVVQITVQMLAGAKQLGAAAASVQLSRSVGAAMGTALVGAVLFASLAAMDADTAALFARLVQIGPSALRGLPAMRTDIVQHEIAAAFRAAFLTIACFAATGSALAWSVPVRRIV